MALSRLAGKLRIPAAAALRRASCPHTSPEEPSRFVASRFFSQGGKSSQTTKYVYQRRDLDQICEEKEKDYLEMVRDAKKSAKIYRWFPVSMFMSSTAAALLGISFAGYLVDAFDEI